MSRPLRSVSLSFLFFFLLLSFLLCFFFWGSQVKISITRRPGEGRGRPFFPPASLDESTTNWNQDSRSLHHFLRFLFFIVRRRSGSRYVPKSNGSQGNTRVKPGKKKPIKTPVKPSKSQKTQYNPVKPSKTKLNLVKPRKNSVKFSKTPLKPSKTQ